MTDETTPPGASTPSFDAVHAALGKEFCELVALSGYRNDLYDGALHGWARVEKSVRAAGQRGTVSRTECLWLNPALANASALSEAA